MDSVTYTPKKSISVHRNIRFNPNLSFGEKFLLAELHGMDEYDRIPFSSRMFSTVFGVSHQTILNWIKKLIELQLIEVFIDYKDPYKYFIKTKKL